MSDKDKYSKKINIPKAYDSDEDTDEGSGGQGSKIGYADFMGGTQQYLREDQLPPDIIRAKLGEHDRTNEAFIKKQKEKIGLREKVPRGEASIADYRRAGKSEIDYWPHPHLSNSQQFDGMDSKSNPVPDLQASDTNPEDRKEQELKYQKQYQPDAPRPRLTDTLRLTRK